MFNLRRSAVASLAGSALALASLGTQAATVEYFAAQGPKVGTDAPPPALSTLMSTKIADFAAATNVLGGNEFEPSQQVGAQTGFGYTGGTAAITSGAPSLIDGDTLTDLTTGRYNMTGGLAADDRGFWIESASSFTYTFAGNALSAFSMFGTDFGDFDGTFTLNLLDTTGQSVFSRTVSTDRGNGNLMFFGVSSTDWTFNAAQFVITQGTGTAIDVLGFDSLRVGTSTLPTDPGTDIPEPASLALVGIALMGLGAATRRRRST